MILLDTNVISELMRAQPEPAVLAWLSSQNPKDLGTTAITVAEIGYGIKRLPAGRRRREITTAARDVFEGFSHQVHPFDHSAANLYGEIVTKRDSSGRPIDGFDAQIAAICRTRRAGLATRNTSDFENTGVTLFNPWDPGD